MQTMRVGCYTHFISVISRIHSTHTIRIYMASEEVKTYGYPTCGVFHHLALLVEAQ